jgi:hypothetical protein
MTITTAYDMDKAKYCLMATNHGRSAIVGPRILQGSGHLSIDVWHDTEKGASEAAVLLRAYLASLPAARKTKTKSKDKSAYD